MTKPKLQRTLEMVAFLNWVREEKDEAISLLVGRIIADYMGGPKAFNDAMNEIKEAILHG